MSFLTNFAKNTVTALLSLMISGLILAGCIYFYMALQLPDVETLKDSRLQIPLRVYSNDGFLMGEFGAMRRDPVPLSQVPRLLIDGVVATEDRRFFEHPGVDFIGLLRASRELILTGKKSQGASTITMQVARNYFLTREKTYTRKLNEILLAIKINSTFSKERILELYLNKIYLGQHAYGVSAAAQIYYGKTLQQLTLPEIAMIAGLPQAPSKDNPITNPQAALERRNHVLERMLEDGYISKSDYERAVAAPNTAIYHGSHITLQAPYAAEMVRNALVQQYGEATYSEGLQVFTTLNARLQRAADASLRDGLMAYDHRHGYRGPEKHLRFDGKINETAWRKRLTDIPTVNDLQPAAVTKVGNDQLTALLANGHTVVIPASTLTWTGRYPRDIARVGDVIRVQNIDNQWQLEQLPRVEGALVSINPNNGAILALSGGFDNNNGNFNRVIQAKRQAGSNFKPFIYAAALAKGYTLSTVINDAPVVFYDEKDHTMWRPHNNELKFYGPTRLRVGLVNSRNLVSIRLLQMIGIPYAIQYLSQFGFDPEQLPHAPSLALGTADLTPLQIATGYSVFANGGFRINPYFVQQIRDANNTIIYQAKPPLACENCQPLGAPTAPRVVDADVAYLMTNVLQDVIREGTGRKAQALNRNDIAGKTGTTNNQLDAWFSGFNRNVVTTAWVGFDQPQPLYEYGADAALPIWMQYMGVALAGKPEATLPAPANITTLKIDATTGLMANEESQYVIDEVFSKTHLPSTQAANEHDSDFSAGDNADAQLF